MTRYTLSFADACSHKPEHPERTAKRSGSGFDVTFQVWPSREAMLKTIEMQGRRAFKQTDWKPVVKDDPYPKGLIELGWFGELPEQVPQ